MTNRRQYKLNNLDCASCASKIEERLSAIDTFSEVSVNFPTATPVSYTHLTLPTNSLV